MSAEVESMFSVRQKPWHGLGVILPDCPTSEEAIVAAGLDWKVEKKPIFDASGNQIPDYFANIRDKDNSVLGVVSGRYTIVQNDEAFSFTDNLVGEGLKWETAGSLRNGKCVWMLGKMPNTTILGEALEQYICFTNTFDGTGSIQCLCTPIRIVCNNTLNLALSTAKRKWSVRHLGDMKSKLYEAQKALGLINDYTKALQKEAAHLVEQKISDAEVEAMLDTMYPINENDSDRKKKSVATLKDNFFYCLQQDDIKQYKGTKYAVVMAATDFADHSVPIRKVDTFYSNRWAQIMQGHPFVDTVYKQLAA